MDQSCTGLGGSEDLLPERVYQPHWRVALAQPPYVVKEADISPPLGAKGAGAPAIAATPAIAAVAFLASIYMISTGEDLWRV